MKKRRAKKSTQIASPASTGNLGEKFETRVQALFVLLMLTGGRAPGLRWPIYEIQLQAKVKGYATDDMIVLTRDPASPREQKMLVQVKTSTNITKGDPTFNEVIAHAWEDFNNQQNYTKGNDMIALITRLLHPDDIEHTRTILDWAKTTKSAETFVSNIRTARFSHAKKQKKLDVFRAALNCAQKVGNVSDDDLLAFMKDFHLIGYDFDTSRHSASGALSFAHSLIVPYDNNPAAVWSTLLDEVAGFNPNAGEITRDIISRDLQDIFAKPIVTPDPVAIKPVQLPADPGQYEYASELALANLFGSWDESNPADREIIAEVTQKDYWDWIKKIRPALQHPDKFIALQNGKRWRITKREALWKALGSQIHDEHIAAFKECAIRVLSEPDPQFEMPADQRFAANIHGKVHSHSPQLRVGLAESLALIGNQSNALENCSQQAKYIAATVREILHDADWVLWGSLNPIIPTLAEADPNEFLDAIEKAAQRSPSPFKKLFSEEGAGEAGGVFGQNYLTGVWWGLEKIAWDPEHLNRVCVVFGSLAMQDPGGKWVNRPSNSLWSILLPWYPQTLADDEQRKAVIKILRRETPEVAWSLALGLLPSGHQHTSGTSKPSWRKTVSADWKPSVTHGEVRSYAKFHSEIVVDMAKGDMQKLEVLADKLDRLHPLSRTEILDHLSSDKMIEKSDSERLPLWEKLTKVVKSHKRFTKFDTATIEKIAEVANALSPRDAAKLRQRLFRQNDHDLYEVGKDWKKEREKLDLQRRQIVQEILGAGGITAVLDFSKSIEAAWRVGVALGAVAGKEHEASILPALLDINDDKLSGLAYAYVGSLHERLGWEWVDGQDTENWSDSQKAIFLRALPFARETWDRTADWLPTANAERKYWDRYHAYFDGTREDFIFAIDKLHEHEQHHYAIALLEQMHRKHGLDIPRCVRSLLAAVSPSEALDETFAMALESLIEALQKNDETDIDELMRVEWAYLPLLAGPGRLSVPGLNKGLALRPEFFCEIIRAIYRPRNSKKSIREIIRAIFRLKNAKKSKQEPSESEQRIAMNAYELLDEWKTPPGTMLDGSFSQSEFEEWFSTAKEILTASGHSEVGLGHIGSVLFYCPEDPQGLWINEVVAAALNADGADELRNGFFRGILNSREAGFLDPSGSEERALASQAREKAKLLDKAGYQRFARTMRDVAESYDREAEMVIRMMEERKERDEHGKPDKPDDENA